MWGEWGEGRTEPTILNQLNIEYHTEIDDCYTGLGVTGDVGGVGGRTEIDDCYTGLGVTGDVGGVGEGRHNTEPTQY